MQVCYIGSSIGLIIRNCNASHQCDNGLSGDSGKLCMATTVTQEEITWCEQNSILLWVHAAYPQKYNNLEQIFPKLWYTCMHYIMYMYKYFKHVRMMY